MDESGREHEVEHDDNLTFKAELGGISTPKINDEHVENNYLVPVMTGEQDNTEAEKKLNEIREELNDSLKHAVEETSDQAIKADKKVVEDAGQSDIDQFQKEKGGGVLRSLLMSKLGKGLRVALIPLAIHFLAACEDEIPVNEIPQAELSELISNPEAYAQLPNLRTSGYPEQVGMRIEKHVVPIVVRTRNSTIVIVQWHSREVDSYKLHTNPNPESSSLELSIRGPKTVSSSPSKQPPGIHLNLNEYQQFVGKIEKVKVQNGNTEVDRYVFTARSVNKIEPPAAEQAGDK